MTVAPQPIRLPPIGKLITIGILIALALWLVRAIGPAMSPFVGAAITAYLFNPLIRRLHQRTHVGRAVWILALYVVVGALAYLFVQFVGPRFIVQFNDLQRQLPSIINQVQAALAANQIISLGGISFGIGRIEQPVLDFLAELGRAIPELVPHLFLTAIESLLLFLTYLIVTFYFLLQSDQIVENMYRLVPARFRDEIRGLGGEIDTILASYIRGTLLLIPIMALVTYVALTILGVRYALVLGIATGFLEVIPLLGPWSAAGIAATVALFQTTAPFGWENWMLAIVVAVTYFVLRMSEDNFIIPYVVGHAVHLHPVLVLFAILAGGALGGPFGLFISIPTVAVVQLLLRYIYRKLVDSPELPFDSHPPAQLAPAPTPQRQPETAPPMPQLQTADSGR
ncbi:MAG: AI-2E family transporter [Roseiflexaceae bacterium]|nr:AI-2E family transporter [Roseiflexaceae bacterium]